MKIEAQPSPNFNDRKHPVDMLILHYTGMKTGQEALDRMCDAEAEVSAHYMIWEDGRIVQLVGEDKRAWHAGISSWQGESDLNSRSIGIEIVNGGHDWPLEGGVLPPYPEAQIEALIELSTGILSRWDIAPTRIVGHSDVAPARKQDPGEHFPWQRLAGAGIGVWPASVANNIASANNPIGDDDSDISASAVQNMLSEIGYQIERSGAFDEGTEAVIRAFQRRWGQDQITGQVDPRTLKMLRLVHPLYLA